MTDPVLSWTGDRFVRISWPPSIPGDARVIFEADTIAPITPADMDAMKCAMAINPTVAVFIAPGLMKFGHPTASDEIAHRAHPDPAWREAFAPRWHPSPNLGTAWKRIAGGRCGVVWLKRVPTGMPATLYHELFHTVAWNFTPEEWSLIAAHGARIRAANLAEDVFSDHPDIRPPLWLGLEEEGPAFAFERFATDQPQPFGIRLPWRLQRLFRRVIRGDFADHRMRFRRGPHVETTGPPDDDE